MEHLQVKINTVIGPLYLVANDQCLTGIFWKQQSAKILTSKDQSSPAAQILEKTEAQLNEYFNGKRKAFDIPLSPEGTEFQKRVWDQLIQIPYGKTCSYKDLATQLKDSNASRAVGTANGKNPISIIIPCHRVISSNGTLGGYAGGLDIKTKLLDLEKCAN